MNKILEHIEGWRAGLVIWVPEMRGDQRAVCLTCRESRLLVAAGLTGKEPHEVRHALIASLGPLMAEHNMDDLVDALRPLAPRIHSMVNEIVMAKVDMFVSMLLNELADEHRKETL